MTPILSDMLRWRDEKAQYVHNAMKYGAIYADTMAGYMGITRNTLQKIISHLREHGVEVLTVGRGTSVAYELKGK